MNKKIKMLTIDFEGYQITEEIKQGIKERIGTNSKFRNYEYLLDTKNRLYNAGIKVFDLELDSANRTGKINYHPKDYNLLLFDPLMIDKELGIKLFLQRTKSSLIRTTSPEIVVGKDFNHRLKEIIDREKVSAICGYGDGEKKYLESIGFVFVNHIIEDFNSIDSQGKYYYIDMQTINSMMIRNDIAENGKIAKSFKSNKLFTTTYKAYSEKAEDVYKAMITTLDDKIPVDSYIKTQLHIGVKDVMLQTVILESLFIYEQSKKGTRLLYTVFNNKNPMGQVKILFDKNVNLKKVKSVKREVTNLKTFFGNPEIIVETDSTRKKLLNTVVGLNFDKIKIISSDNFKGIKARSEKEIQLEEDQVNPELQNVSVSKRTLALEKMHKEISASDNIVCIYHDKQNNRLIIALNEIQIIGKINYKIVDEDSFNQLFHVFKIKPSEIVKEDIPKILPYFKISSKELDPLRNRIKQYYSEFKIPYSIKQSNSISEEETSYKETIQKLINEVIEKSSIKNKKPIKTLPKNPITLTSSLTKKQNEFLAYLEIFYNLNGLNVIDDIFSAYHKSLTNSFVRIKAVQTTGDSTKKLFSKNFVELFKIIFNVIPEELKTTFLIPRYTTTSNVLNFLSDKAKNNFINSIVNKNQKYITFHY